MRLCVFCGASNGNDPAYLDAARSLGAALAAAGIELVYGGAAIGLMGAVADAALAGGGIVRGVMPRALIEKEIAHRGLTELHSVETMHERKAFMADLADGFIALPGGLGTFEELFEVWTWAQLGWHKKPCALFDVNGFYEKLTAFLDHVVDSGFVQTEHRQMLLVERSAPALLAAIAAYVPPAHSKRIVAPAR